eukprot:symbB.v1.2.037108.t1/scaffold5391.1/size27629/1
MCPAAYATSGHGSCITNAATTDTTRSSGPPVCSSTSYPWPIRLSSIPCRTAPGIRYTEAPASGVHDTLTQLQKPKRWSKGLRR